MSDDGGVLRLETEIWVHTIAEFLSELSLSF